MNYLLENKLSEFVSLTTKGRDDSHGHQHMEIVANNAKLIMSNMTISPDQYRWSLIVSWLHDVADHKYDKDGKLKHLVENFLHEIETDSESVANIIKCIDMVSFSKEEKNGYKYYENELPTNWIIVRNIASDSDKLEAIGEIGIIRCQQYAQEKSESKLSKDESLMYVWQHAQDKLLHLSKLYIHTKMGKELSKPRHTFMFNWLKEQGIDSNTLSFYELKDV